MAPARKLMIYNARNRLRNYEDSEVSLTQDHYVPNFFNTGDFIWSGEYLDTDEFVVEDFVFNKVKRL